MYWLLNINQPDAVAPGVILSGGKRDFQRRACCHDHRALHDVAKLANISRPGILLQRRQAFTGNLVDPLGERLAVLLDEVPHQLGNVFDAFAQRRYANRKDIEPIEQVLAKGSRDPSVPRDRNVLPR